MATAISTPQAARAYFIGPAPLAVFPILAFPWPCEGLAISTYSLKPYAYEGWGLVEPRRVVIDFGEFEVEVVVRPKARRVVVERVVERRAEGPRPRRARLAVVLDQMLRIGSFIEPRVPEGTTIYEGVGVGLEKELKVSDALIRVPVRDDYDICELALRLAGEHDKVLVFTGDKALVNDLKVMASERGVENVAVHYLPPSETASRAQLIEEILKRIREAAQSHTSQASSEPRKANKQN